MINYKFLFLSIIFSIFVHLSVILIFNFKKKNTEIYVVNLSEFQEFSFSKPPPNETKEIFEEQTKKEIIKKPIIKKEIIKKIHVEEQINKEDILKLKTNETKLVKKSEVQKIEQKTKVKKKIEEFKKNDQTQLSNNKSQKKISNLKKGLVIDNKLLSEYLSFISFEINKIASRSYPLQSIKRREQGTITPLLIINKEGKLVNIEIKNKSPKRLYKATTKILRTFNFPKPPNEILNSEGFLKIKIPVNFILK